MPSLPKPHTEDMDEEMGEGHHQAWCLQTSLQPEPKGALGHVLHPSRLAGKAMALLWWQAHLQEVIAECWSGIVLEGLADAQESLVAALSPPLPVAGLQQPAEVVQALCVL